MKQVDYYVRPVEQIIREALEDIETDGIEENLLVIGSIGEEEDVKEREEGDVEERGEEGDVEEGGEERGEEEGERENVIVNGEEDVIMKGEEDLIVNGEWEEKGCIVIVD